MKYEFIGIIKPFLPEDVRIGLIEKIKKTITGPKGKIISEDIWGKRHLAYPIAGHEEGYYILYKLEADPEEIKKCEKELRLVSDLIRFMITRE